MDSRLRADLEEDRLRLVLEYLETENPQDQPLLALIELLLGVPEEG